MSRTAQLPPGTYSEPAAERAFLGYYLETTGDRADLRAEVLALDLDLFTVPKHRTVATAMQQIAATGDPVNVTTVEHRLHTASANVTQADLHALVSQAAVTPGSYRRVLVDYQGRRRVDSIL